MSRALLTAVPPLTRPCPCLRDDHERLFGRARYVYRPIRTRGHTETPVRLPRTQEGGALDTGGNANARGKDRHVSGHVSAGAERPAARAQASVLPMYGGRPCRIRRQESPR